ncbi:signal peptidase II [Alicyclobacillus cycloheptanicus]|uniref:Lipoprotein signal peptidase n=1 Tax=Alicyclobacillus cycloheptanicus TaxID=1457 RepID=A0ABT9XL10_9BACL|nr:signal peptidase II [Alicyclobacillus cycloheptanicus]MDQ0190991.1 signal peptidase II [Alicyclobacillus cycloheptanicus]WDM01482.1 signal peptidase II [Alicyclobacillus cycloheptanicus]
MVYVIAILAWVIDQGLKWVVRSHLLPDQLVPVLPPAFYFDYIRNPGAAFGILPNARWLFIVVALIVIVAVIVIQRRWHLGVFAQVGLGLVLGGAVGNLTDRVISGTVVDYVYFKPINFPIFNFADVCIDVGVAILILTALLGERQGRTSGRASTPAEVRGEADE